MLYEALILPLDVNVLLVLMALITVYTMIAVTSRAVKNKEASKIFLFFKKRWISIPLAARGIIGF